MVLLVAYPIICFTNFPTKLFLGCGVFPYESYMGPLLRPAREWQGIGVVGVSGPGIVIVIDCW